MKFTVRDKTMFQAAFSPTREEARTLLDYVRFLWEEEVGARIAAHPLYRPSDLWKHWAGQTFMGFSLDTILLQGGHAFPSSVEVGLGGEEAGNTSRWRRCLPPPVHPGPRHRARLVVPVHVPSERRELRPESGTFGLS